MTDFKPILIDEPVNHLEFLTPGIDYPAGSKFGIARVVSNDGEWAKFCYEYGEINCQNCVETECPFKNTSRKEG